MNWEIVKKTFRPAVELADGHYTRQKPGTATFCRPGFNLVLYMPGAVFAWFRPKWESGLPGTERKDRLRALECTMFRNRPKLSGRLSSDLIVEAEAFLLRWDRALDVALPDGLITAVGVEETSARRSKRSPPGKCFLEAGWSDFKHLTSKRRDIVWLRKSWA